MSETRSLLCDTARAAFTDAASGGIAVIEAAGFATLLSPAAEGGFGGDWGDVDAVLRIAGVMVPELPVAALILGDACGDRGAVATVSLMAGAMEETLKLSIAHANLREQFGRPIGKFQAVQQSLAVMACEVAAVAAAARALATRLDRTEGDVSGAGFEIAAAKLRANRAVGVVTSRAHQVHGAIGFTQEHGLHRLTTALMRWRSEAGHDDYWAQRLGSEVAAIGGTELWAALTERTD